MGFFTFAVSGKFYYLTAVQLHVSFTQILDILYNFPCSLLLKRETPMFIGLGIKLLVMLVLSCNDEVENSLH